MPPPSDHDGASPTGTHELVEHLLVTVDALPAGVSGDNVILLAKSAKGAWIESLTRLIGPLRSRSRSTYFHWAMAINGLHIAAERYRDRAWQSEHGSFVIRGLRKDDPNAILASWDGDSASQAHMFTVPKMAAWGYIELFACLEQSVFDLYRAYLSYNPDALLQGDDYRKLRRLRMAAASPSATEPDKAAWNAAWAARLDNWHRKRLYDGLHRVFLALCTEARLGAPKSMTSTTVATWAETIEGLGLVRHALIHGATLVSPELAAFCKTQHSMGFSFIDGTPLRVALYHLQAFELFLHQLLSALNLALAEHPDAGQ